MKKEVAASILGKKNKIKLINKLIKKNVNWIHYDVMDGEFVSNYSMPIKELLFLFKNTLDHKKDVHLMVHNPSFYIKSLLNFVDQFSIHFESKYIDSLESVINKYSSKIKLGLVVNPLTSIDKVFPYLKKLNHVMIMSVFPGKGGQKFIETSIEKILELKKEIKNQNLKTIIEIDGGINNITGPRVFNKGVNLAVSGSYLINNIEDKNILKKIIG